MTQPAITLQIIRPAAGTLRADLAQVIAGPRGKDGAGLHITGLLPNTAALPATAQPGDAYLIAGELHVWIAGDWVNTGPVQGPQGPPGPPGHPGQIRFTGHGAPPMVIVGAEPGDTYLCLDTGNVYKLT